jgi:hypothetical protein
MADFQVLLSLQPLGDSAVWPRTLAHRCDVLAVRLQTTLVRPLMFFELHNHDSKPEPYMDQTKRYQLVAEQVDAALPYR